MQQLILILHYIMRYFGLIVTHCKNIYHVRYHDIIAWRCGYCRETSVCQNIRFCIFDVTVKKKDTMSCVIVSYLILLMYDNTSYYCDVLSYITACVYVASRLFCDLSPYNR